MEDDESMYATSSRKIVDDWWKFSNGFVRTAFGLDFSPQIKVCEENEEKRFYFISIVTLGDPIGGVFYLQHISILKVKPIHSPYTRNIQNDFTSSRAGVLSGTALFEEYTSLPHIELYIKI